MRSQSNGTLAAVLMLVPLITVAALAVFGIPQFVAVVASPVQSEYDSRGISRVGVGESLGHQADDLFANFDRDSQQEFRNLQRTDTSIQKDWDDPFHRTSVIVRERGNENQDAGTNTSKDSIDGDALGGWRRESLSKHEAAANTEPQRQPLTWKTAIARLREIGIREYRLQPAERPNEFHFSCSYTPADNPRITHLFEAEAAEPLRAVEKVLDQITAWSRER